MLYASTPIAPLYSALPRIRTSTCPILGFQSPSPRPWRKSSRIQSHLAKSFRTLTRNPPVSPLKLALTGRGRNCPQNSTNKSFRIKCQFAKSFRTHSYEKCACKSFRIHSYKMYGFEVPSNHTLTKKGGGGIDISHQKPFAGLRTFHQSRIIPSPVCRQGSDMLVSRCGKQARPRPTPFLTPRTDDLSPWFPFSASRSGSVSPETAKARAQSAAWRSQQRWRFFPPLDGHAKRRLLGRTER